MIESPSALSRPVSIATIAEDGSHVRVEATPEERAVLAEADGLLALHRLVGEFDLTPRGRGGGFAVRGSVSATLEQTCTVSLDAFESEIREAVDLIFMPAERAAAWAEARKAEVEPGLQDEDPPEIITNGRIDLGAVTAEFLALGLDPYPRKPGISFEPVTDGSDKDPSPFAALAKFRKAP